MPAHQWLHQLLGLIKTHLMTLLTSKESFFHFGIYPAQYNRQHRHLSTHLLCYYHLWQYFPWSSSISNLQLVTSCALWDSDHKGSPDAWCHSFIILLNPLVFFVWLNSICVRSYSSSTMCQLLGLNRAVPVWESIEVTVATVWRCIISLVIAL